ncbi:16115_t:CDS:2 [Funneliformis caledonium]|uniref:16115_t:CDS:1 n=1 Tax=Funneliformis caledonium TaxID=1117310 RepID=A0A9N9IEZ6_9GLOM|nr:16115_t:CDS:2 [Funneliformis caledonium]
MTNDVARVYFVDNQGNSTQPPAGTVLHMYGYEITHNDTKIFCIKNQKQQALTVIEQ